MQNKASLRQLLREKRCALSKEIRERAAFSAIKQLSQHPLFQNSQHIGVYFALAPEFATRPLIEKIWESEKKCYLPTLSTRDKKLQFFLYTANDRIRLNHYQIGESENSASILANYLDLVILPLVGFDLKGHRLGLGGGYYDATFAFKIKNVNTKPFLLGLGFEVQEVLSLPHDEWDVPLNGLLTEKKLLIF